ncbi:MAG: hypothetical protein HYY92_03010 [Parcubacteria group bacterium]|nr:hypothetical protein [Parcubacteria group bacterium]
MANHVRIYLPKEIPREGFEAQRFQKMDGYAIDAYPFQVEDPECTSGAGGDMFSEEARAMAVRTVAAHFGVSQEKTLNLFDVCIVPAVGFHGTILARRKAA